MVPWLYDAGARGLAGGTPWLVGSPAVDPGALSRLRIEPGSWRIHDEERGGACGRPLLGYAVSQIICRGGAGPPVRADPIGAVATTLRTENGAELASAARSAVPQAAVVVALAELPHVQAERGAGVVQVAVVCDALEGVPTREALVDLRRAEASIATVHVADGLFALVVLYTWTGLPEFTAGVATVSQTQLSPGTV